MIEFECFHKYNLDNNEKEIFNFEITKYRLGHREFLISLVIWDYLIFSICFYNPKEKW